MHSSNVLRQVLSNHDTGYARSGLDAREVGRVPQP